MNAARILNMARRRAGLTQRELSRKTGVAQPSISKIEHGLISPTVDTLERLIRACGMELEPVDVPGEHDLDWTLFEELLQRDEPGRAQFAAGMTRGLQRLRAAARIRR
jgi:transcriptional regulator with XRE-family HTH domain